MLARSNRDVEVSTSSKEELIVNRETKYTLFGASSFSAFIHGGETLCVY